LGLPGNHDLIELMCTHAVTLIGSLPSPFQSATDSQRGKGVFEASIKVLQQLNHKGYGDGIGLKLNLVYNPTGDFLPPECGQLEYDYRGILKDAFGIQFNSFIPIVNVPIKRFRKFLEKEGTLSQYEHELFTQFNSATIEKIMCRYLISVDNKGYVYDCDFNLATGTRIKGYENVRFWDINFDVFEPEISFDKYCYACTVNQGSSCHGTLVKDATSAFNVKDSVKTYYGDILTSSNDLQTNACCTIDSIPHYVRESLRYVNDEIKMKYYGCGSPIPYVLEGLQALDVGCGTGRDVYVLSRLVGEHGFVWGIDMTEKQLDVAKKHMDEQMEIFGYNKRNVGFIHDYIENLGSHFQKESLDLIISNCVMNLSEDKEVVLQQIFDVLKHGGEFYFSDVYADRRVPAHIARNEVLYGECLGGALYYKDFERIARRVGFTDVRVVDSRTITINNPEIEQLVENITFLSVTYRLWKLRELEDVCEDYGHIAIYRGGIPFSLFKYELDREHVFYKNKPERVCGNTAMMIQNTRLGKYFEIIGDFSEHFGVFEECTTQSHEHEQENEKTGGCC
ncbi:MAG: DUF3641 domain-containing protein, partial [Thermodesulfobacteriota bacterium]|nr:DUF3641 domain-containing protein [Thermodesulfobacteriota bacterium]